MKSSKYLACGLDTDGSIYFSRYKLRSGAIGYHSKVSFGNDSLEWIKHIKNLTHGKGRIEPNGKGHWKLVISDQKTILELLSFIKNNLIIKKRKANWMIEFCKSRLKREHHKKSYTKHERELILLVRGGRK